MTDGLNVVLSETRKLQYLAVALPSGKGLDCLHSSVIQVVRRNHDRQPLQNLLPGFHVRALQAHNERHIHSHLLRCVHHTTGNNIALHDPTEDVHQDGLHFWVGGQNLEGFHHLLLRRVAAHVEKIGGRTPVELDDVHGGHGQASTVHHASDLPIQANVVEVVLGGRHLPGVLLCLILKHKELLLPEGRVVIKPKLGIRRVESAVGGLRHRVHFHQRAVSLHKQLVQCLDLLCRSLTVTRHPEPLGDIQRLLVRDAGPDVDGHAQDFVGELLREVLDACASLATRDNHWASRGTVQQDRKIHLLRELHLLRHQHRVHRLPCLTRLLGHQRLPQHLARDGWGLSDGHDVHPALEATLEGAQPTSTS
mmetsp:Transcript_11076/g.19946  ORF Transcript_11076/g.19946 Transcript_11076/m.19946 type:complete len:365 (-) Transcript_11076:375-1469(-)